jgi:hypothetical protein
VRVKGKGDNGATSGNLFGAIEQKLVALMDAIKDSNNNDAAIAHK